MRRWLMVLALAAAACGCRYPDERRLSLRRLHLPGGSTADGAGDAPWFSLSSNPDLDGRTDASSSPWQHLIGHDRVR